MIYLDNAATTGKKPQNVIRAVNKALYEYSANPGRSGHSSSLKAASAVYRVREKAAAFFGASGPERVIFTMNCTHSLNCVIKGVLSAGDHCIVSSLEHNAVMRPLIKTGIAFDTARVSLSDDNITLAEFERKIKLNTKLIICTGASNVLGKTLPIAKIGALCRARGIFFCLDAAQTAGVIPIDMNKMNIDFLCVAPHKGLYAPMGIGILICEKEIKNTIIEGGTGTNSAELFQPDSLPERLESGTVNLPAIIGTSAGIDYVNGIGTEKVYAHEMKLCKYLYEELSHIPNVQLYTPNFESGMYVPLITFNIGDIDSGETAKILDSAGIAVRGGLHCAPSAHYQMGTVEKGAVRVSVATFNTFNEIKYLVNTVKNIKIA